MKKPALFLAHLALVFAASGAFASEVCRDTLTQALQLEFNTKGWTFYSLKAVAPSELDKKLSTYQGNSLELKQADREKLAGFETQENLEFYLLNGTSSYAVSFMDVVVVETGSCAILQRNTVYFE